MVILEAAVQEEDHGPQKRWLDNVAEDGKTLHVSVPEANSLAQDKSL